MPYAWKEEENSRYSDRIINSTVRHSSSSYKIHTKFPKCYLFMDEASHLIINQRRLKHILIIIKILNPSVYTFQLHHHRVYGNGRGMKYSQMRSACSKILSSFADFKNKVSIYFRTKRFNLDMRNYLLRGAI